MLKDMPMTCPKWGRETLLAVASPDTRVEKKGSTASCRNCCPLPKAFGLDAQRA